VEQIIERTLVILKPTSVGRRIVGRITAMIEDKGLKIIAMKMVWIDRDKAERHYGEHRGREFFEKLIDHITSAPVVLMVIEGERAVRAVRQLCGETDPIEAHAGSVRGTFGIGVTENLVHASDSTESAKREIEFFFNEEEIFEY